MSKTIRYDGGSDSHRTWSHEIHNSNSYRGESKYRQIAKRRLRKARRNSDDVDGIRGHKSLIENY